MHPQLIFCSGDIAYAGKPDDYIAAKVFFDKLLVSASLDKERLHVVPGNHDVDINRLPLPAEPVDDEAKSEKCFGDPVTLGPLVERFHGFQRFCSDFLGRQFDQFRNRYFVRMIPLNGFRIGFVGVNSAWFARGEGKDDHQLVLGKRVLQDAFAELESLGRPDMTIFVLHHPIDRFMEFERHDTRALMMGKADVVLSGHMHKPWAEGVRESSTGKKVCFVEAGATRQIDKLPIRACFVQADIGRKKLKIYPITYVDGQWDTDTTFPGLRGDHAPVDLSWVQRTATFKVENLEELEDVANLTPFVENLAVGKFVEKKRWSDLRKEVDFSKLQPVDLSSSDKMIIIKGGPGMGKSTYVLWSLDESLRNKARADFKVVFLHPDSYESWAEELYDHEPSETLLVIDALRRGTDSHAHFRGRCLELLRLTSGERKVNEKPIGPFKVLATIRNDEYADLRQKVGEFEWVSPKIIEIKPEDLDPEKILKKLLASYEVPYKTPADQEESMVKELASKSEGSPFYIRHLVTDLKRRNTDFSAGVFKEYPLGMVNLIWHIIKRGYYIRDDDAIPFLLLLLSNGQRHLSDSFFGFVTEKLAPKRLEVEDKIKSLKAFYLQETPTLDNNKNFALDSHWKEGLAKGVSCPEAVVEDYHDVTFTYRRISDMHYRRLIEQISKELGLRLKEGLKDKADAFLCLDLAGLGIECLEAATEIYTNLSSSSTLDQRYVEHIRDELYEMWITNAWKFRGLHSNTLVMTCYDNAFERLGVRTHRKQLHAYAVFLTRYVLPTMKGDQYEGTVTKIDSLYKEVIKLEPQDTISYQAYALFYKAIGNFSRADQLFKEAIKIEPNHIPTLQAYAIFLGELGRAEWFKNQQKALDYLDEAQKTFESAIEQVKSKAQHGELSEKEKQYEKQLLNAYAVFLIRQAGRQTTPSEKQKYDERADSLFTELLGKYPGHKETINKYADFLMKYGWILPRYEGGKHVVEAERILVDLLKGQEEKKEPRDRIALHTLAVLLWRFKPRFDQGVRDFERASTLLQESAKSFDPKHNSIAQHELARLYLKWAGELRLQGRQEEYRARMDLAKEAIKKAFELPENPTTFLHLSRIYVTQAFLMIYEGDSGGTKRSIEKGLELAERAPLSPRGYHHHLISIGNKLDNEHPKEAIEVFQKAIVVGEELGLNNSYPLHKLGECQRRTGDAKGALQSYLESARAENTSKGYGTRRRSIRRLMEEFQITKSTSPDLYDECIKGCLECSTKAYHVDPSNLMNQIDYIQDLSENGRHEDAERITRELARGLKRSRA